MATANYFNGHGSYGTTAGRTGLLFDYMRKQGDGSRENLNFKLNDVNVKVVQGAGDSHTCDIPRELLRRGLERHLLGAASGRVHSANPRSNPFRNDFFYADRYGASATHAFAVNGNAVLMTNRVLEHVQAPLVATIEQLRAETE